MSLMDKMLKAGSIKHAGIMSESSFFKARDVIQTRIPIVNVAFSGSLDGGLTPGLTILAGASKTFKTVLALTCLAAYLDKYPDAVGLLYDSEFSLTPDYLKSVGIDPARCIHIPIEHIEQFKFDITKRLDNVSRGDKVFVLVDSLGVIPSKKEVEDALDEKSVADMTRAKALRSMLRLVTAQLSNKDIPMVAIAHVYSTMELYSKTIVSGGTAIQYMANQVFIISKAQDKDADGLAGWNFTINIEKSRYVREKSKFMFNVSYKKGINKWSGLLDLATEAGMVEKVRKRSYVYHYIDPETGEVDPTDYSEADTNTSKFWNRYLTNQKFKEFVENKFSLKGDLIATEEDEDVSDIYSNLEDDDA